MGRRVGSRGLGFLGGASVVTPISRQHSEVPSGLSAPTRGSGYSACVKGGSAIVGTGIDQRANGPLLSMSC